MIDDVLIAVIIGAATWRLSFAVTQEDVFRWLRELFGAKLMPVTINEWGAERTVERIVQTAETRPYRAIGALLSCLYCTSFWVSLILWGFWLYPNAPDLPLHLFMAFASATIAAIIEIWRTK